MPFFFLSSPQVLETGDDLQEVSGNGDFFTQGPTLCAGNVGTRAAAAAVRIVQVFRGGVLLFNGIKLVSKLDVAPPEAEAEAEIVAADIADPFVLLRMADGSVR